MKYLIKLSFLFFSIQGVVYAQPGMVLGVQKISDTQGGYTGTITGWTFGSLPYNEDKFAGSVSKIGDVNGDGVPDIAVGSYYYNAGDRTGKITIMFLNTDGTVQSHQDISDTQGNFTGQLTVGDWFGSSIAGVGDFNGDGVPDILVGAPRDMTGTGAQGYHYGAIYLLFLNSNGTVNSFQKIASNTGGFTGLLSNPANQAAPYFGSSIAKIGDLDGNGVVDFVVGAKGDDDGGGQAGAVWILFMNANGTVQNQQKISNFQGGLGNILTQYQQFGWGVACLGDLNGDGVLDIAVTNLTTIFILFLNTNGTINSQQQITATTGGFSDPDGNFKFSISSLCDMNGDGTTDILVGGDADSQSPDNAGAAYVLLLNPNGTVLGQQKISSLHGNLNVSLDYRDYFGISVSAIGDVDGDGMMDVVIGAIGDDDGGSNKGAVYVCFLESLTVLNPPDTIEICGGQPYVLEASVLDADAYQWSDGSTDSTLEVSTAGTYWVDVFQNCCSHRDSFYVEVTSELTIDLGNDTILCLGSILLDATSISASYLWQDNSTGPTFNVTTPGTYWVEINANGCVGTDTIEVTYSMSNPSPGSNGFASLCSNGTTVNLFDSLGGTSSIGGSWLPALSGGYLGTFNPTTNIAGTYTYTVTDCSGNILTANVVVTITNDPNSGINGVAVVCAGSSTINLMDSLLGIPDISGTWSGPSALAGGDLGAFDPTTNTAGTYIYTVTNSCGSSNNEVVVTVNPCSLPVSLFTLSDDTICLGDCISLIDQSTGATSWLWTIGGGTPNSSIDLDPGNVCFHTQGTFNIEQMVTNSSGSNSSSLSVVVNPVPIIFVSPDITINLGESVNLSVAGSTVDYTWTPPTWLDCVTCADPISVPEETITYSITIVDPNGCVASDNVTVTVDYDLVIFVPNIFSPNGDGNNDILYVRGVGVQSLNFVVYDRWGEKVFETKNLDNGWNGSYRGKTMNNAVFVYYLKATFIDGTETEQKGDLTLIR
jgi:gliding motility-associated-like protein